MAHTNAIRAIVDGQPIRSQDDRTFLQRQLQERRDFYREHGTYENEAQRRRAIEIFDEAIEKLMGESID